VVKARAEAGRVEAELTLSRAAQLPGVAAQRRVTGGGTQSGVTAGGEGLGIGTRRSLQALDAAREAAERDLAQTRETAARSLSQLSGQLASAQRRAEEARSLAIEADTTWELTRAQFDAGRLGVSSAVSVFEAKVRAEREAVTLAHEALALQAQMAAKAGVLVDGERL
jgi:hypothetical protein